MNAPSITTTCLEVRALCKTFAANAVLTAVDIWLARGEVLAVLGSSGSGKTTLLRILAGLEVADSGRVNLAGRRAEQLPPETRGAIYLYQEPLLFPHLDVFENIAFGLRLRGCKTRDIAREIEPLLEELDLAGFGRRRPETLSGGQRQRVAFARALVIRPALLLLNEPFSNLDPDTRANMQTLFKRVAQRHAIGAVFVTHDLKEALLVGDRFARLDRGQLLTYTDRDDFCADPLSGVHRELDFWATLTRDLRAAIERRHISESKEQT